MKKRLILLVLVLCVFGLHTVSAKEENYVTSKGISLTAEEYHFLTNFYWDSYPEEMTEAQYEEFKKSDFLSRKLQVNTRGTWHSSAYKNIKIASACSSNCIISLTLNWTIDPSVRSYDVIGIRTLGVSLISHDYTVMTYSGGSSYFYNTQQFYNGVGNSVKLPDTGTSIRVFQQVTTTSGGIVFGSYQHATSNVTLAVSKYYTISSSGLGGVFDFYGSAYGIYDGFGGVDISI